MHFTFYTIYFILFTIYKCLFLLFYGSILNKLVDSLTDREWFLLLNLKLDFYGLGHKSSTHNSHIGIF